MQQALATDLDGTLIPLDGNSENLDDLKSLTQLLADATVELLFVTGRHFESVAEAMREKHLPTPNWIICDVGTTILQRDAAGEYSKLSEYRNALSSITQHLERDDLEKILSDVEGLRRQEEEKQGEFKLSFYCDEQERERVSESIEAKLEEHQAPFSLISSVDPFNGDGLIDLLPKGVSKAFALDWWTDFSERPRDSVIFAGDSGNDTHALTAGYHSIVVANANPDVVANVRYIHESRGSLDKLFVATKPATSGVLEGCQFFELFQVG